MTFQTKQIFTTCKKLLLFIFILSFLASCESRKTIVNALDEREANEILVFLSSKGIDANKVQEVAKGGGGNQAVLWDISVSAVHANEAMAYLNQAGLPRRRSENLLGIFSDTGLVPSTMTQKIRYQAGLAAQIASTIRKIDGVLDSDVQLSFPEENPLDPTAVKQKFTASVYVKHNGVLDDPNSHLISRIKQLVAGSVPGLTYDDVTVIGDRARFADSAGVYLGGGDEEKQYVSVWGINLAKDSLTLFRIVFFSLSLATLILLLLFCWMIWKFHHVLAARGGIKQLFNYHPIQMEALPPVVEPTQELENKEKEEKEIKPEEAESTAGKEIDET